MSLDLFASEDAPAPPEPEWTEVTIPRGTYRWRLWPDRVPREWRDAPDMAHPELLHRPPFGAFDLEVQADGSWQVVRYGPAIWEVWQVVREERPWEREIDDFGPSDEPGKPRA